MSAPSVLKIVAGGQTGVDRAALDAALDAGSPCGGWCPAGRVTEDGPLASKYPLEEFGAGGYIERTLANVKHSDGTAVIYAGTLEGGTGQTVAFCIEQHKPYQLVDSAQVPVERAADAIAGFIALHGITTLNVAGPRASKQPQIYAYAYAVLSRLLRGPAGPRVE